MMMLWIEFIWSRCQRKRLKNFVKKAPKASSSSFCHRHSIVTSTMDAAARWISLLKWIRKLLQTRTWNVHFFLCFCCKTRMKIWEKRTPENSIAICSFIIHWNQIPWAEADDKTSKDFCSLWMNFHCCIIASEMLWVASASATQRTRRRRRQKNSVCSFMSSIWCYSIFQPRTTTETTRRKKKKTYHEILFSNSKGKQVVKIFFLCSFKCVCERKKSERILGDLIAFSGEKRKLIA